MAKTIIYIDGFNLYYSRLKGTAFKWLDLVALFRDQIVLQQDPSAQVHSVKFFTSPVKASYARHGQASEHAQTQYHRALLAKYPDLIEIIKGFHIFQPTGLPVFEEGQAPSKSKVAKVWMIEEKQTDVNIALQAYRDVARGICDQVVICSNDSDLEPALRLIHEDAPAVTIGLIMPLGAHAQGDGKVPNKRLTPLAHWVRHHILDDELMRAQLPQNVHTKKKPAIKPPHW
ncbi:MAG: NYN domain-containing protein [Polaromonas sp.]